jgi:hypothetical protein
LFNTVSTLSETNATKTVTPTSTYTIKKLLNHKINDALDVTAGYVIIDSKYRS